MIQTLLERLDRPKQTGQNVWQARCPAHEDRLPSLRIKLTDDDHILIHCFAGCGAVDVMAALGMSLSDLYPEKRKDSRSIKRPFMPADVFAIVQAEVAALAIISADMLNGKPHDHARLMESWNRLETIGRMAYGRG